MLTTIETLEIIRRRRMEAMNRMDYILEYLDEYYELEKIPHLIRIVNESYAAEKTIQNFVAHDYLTTKKEERNEVFLCTNFDGLYDTNQTAAVVVAPNIVVAKEILIHRLHFNSLPQDENFQPELIRLNTEVQDVVVLNDGDYKP